MPLGIAWLDVISDGEAKSAQVIGDDAEGDIILFLLSLTRAARTRQSRSEAFAAESTNGREEGTKNVGLVVGYRGAKIGEILRTLHDAGNTLKPHASIDVAGGERNERTIGIGIKLNEDKIPDLDALGAAFID